NASFGLEKNRENNFLYTLSRRIKGDEVNGIQQNLILNKSVGKLKLNGKGFYMINNKEQLYSDWKRMELNVGWNGNKITPGLVYSFDRNTLSSGGGIVGSAMYYDEIKAYFRTSSDTAKVKICA